MTAAPATAVVVGASGILGPAGPMLRSRGLRPLGVSLRNEPPPGWYDEVVRLDARDPDAVRRALAPLTDERVVVAYGPALTPESWAELSAGAQRAVLVVTSSWADPARPADEAARWTGLRTSTVLQLGWTDRPPRWHTPAEVSAAAVPALDLPRGGRPVLGRVRPWQERPG